uniref:Uncharacterized protein n=1 Tax=Timema poppense TaxID=170557 RepID=A0A7R9HFF7_TIMPO|nr:unnamed protein product [Timema poppensis]
MVNKQTGSYFASLTDLENSLWGDPHTSGDLIALGSYMEELNGNDTWGHMMSAESTSNSTSTTVPSATQFLKIHFFVSGCD